MLAPAHTLLALKHDLVFGAPCLRQLLCLVGPLFLEAVCELRIAVVSAPFAVSGPCGYVGDVGDLLLDIPDTACSAVMLVGRGVLISELKFYV